MRSVKLSIIATFMYAAAFFAMPAVAQESNCSFNSQLDSAGISYSVTASSEDACKSQIVRISVHKDGNPFAQLITPPSPLIVEKAWIVDLDDDGKDELIIISHAPADESKKSMGLYLLDGGALRQVKFPEPPDMTGYRGGDRFQRDGVRLIRQFPVYLPQDVNGTPTGGERRIVYQYRNRELLLGSASDAATPVTVVKKDAKRVVSKDKKRAVVKLTGIKPKADYIEIQANGPIENYKIVRIEDPWRLIVDISGAIPAFQYKVITINSHGVSTARIGEHKGFTRIVFDTTIAPMPTETVTPAENALRIGFYINTAK